MIALFLIAAAVFAADFFIKKHMDEQLEEGEEQEILGGKVILTKKYNTGLAMETLKEKPQLVKVIHAAVAGIFLFCYTLIVRESGSKAKKVGSAFILGAGLSNLYDRLVKGHVVDYIRIPFKKLKSLSKVIFNLSDVFLFVGTILVLFGGGKKKK